MTTYAVVDTETTGFEDEDRLVEIGAVHSDGRMLQSLVCPGDRRISFGAMATHHITQEMVSDALPALDALYELGLGPASQTCQNCGGSGDVLDTGCDVCDGRGFEQAHPESVHPDVLVFHNAEFDRGFLPEYLRSLPYVCTWRCALHLVPDAESHSNGALWYELGLQHPMPPEAGQMPHRALFDALMTRDIVQYMIELLIADRTIIGAEDDAHLDEDAAIRHLVWLTKQPVLLEKCRFGKHRGERWEDVPSGYMSWVLGQDFDEDTKHTCRTWLERRGR